MHQIACPRASTSELPRLFQQALRALTLGLLAWGLSACSLEDESLTLVKPRLEIDLQLAEDFARLFNEPGELQIELIANPDPDKPGIEAVKSGFADLALVANTETYDPRVSTVVPLYPTVLHIAHRMNGDGRDHSRDDVLGDLKNRTVFAGPPGSPSRMLLETTVLRDGIEPEEINYLTAADGCADVLVVYAAVLPRVQGNISSCGGYRLFSLGVPESIGSGTAIDAVTLLNPTLKPFVIPADTYGDITPGPIVTLAVDKLLVARTDMSETVVYDLLREVLRLKPALSASHPGLFHQLTGNFDTSGMSFVMHPGAMAYLQRDEPDFYERYSGIAEVAVTLLIGLVSGIYGIWKIIGIRRKNRIDAFCREAIELRDRHLDQGVGIEATVEALKALQDKAYGLMIEERLSADESFRIFITLCNDIIADITGAGRKRHT